MRKLLLSLLCVAALPAGAEELIVEAGEERLLSQPSVHLQRLVLKDGAVAEQGSPAQLLHTMKPPSLKICI